MSSRFAASRKAFRASTISVFFREIQIGGEDERAEHSQDGCIASLLAGLSSRVQEEWSEDRMRRSLSSARIEPLERELQMRRLRTSLEEGGPS